MQADKYVKLWGSGAIVFKAGFTSTLPDQLPEAVVLDSTSFGFTEAGSGAWKAGRIGLPNGEEKAADADDVGTKGGVDKGDCATPTSGGSRCAGCSQWSLIPAVDGDYDEGANQDIPTEDQLFYCNSCWDKEA